MANLIIPGACGNQPSVWHNKGAAIEKKKIVHSEYTHNATVAHIRLSCREVNDHYLKISLLVDLGTRTCFVMRGPHAVAAYWMFCKHYRVAIPNYLEVTEQKLAFIEEHNF